MLKPSVFVTGASGLLGRALVTEVLDAGFSVFAQYYSHRPVKHRDCRWVWADFSNLGGIRDFLHTHGEELRQCGRVVNNYGPITHKPFSALAAEDFLHDFHCNVLTAFEITTYLLQHAQLTSVVNIGFEHSGEVKAYKNVLTYGIAKNALLLLTKSFEKQYPGIIFHHVAPPTLSGAKVKARKGKVVSPQSLAKEILQLI